MEQLELFKEPKAAQRRSASTLVGNMIGGVLVAGIVAALASIGAAVAILPMYASIYAWNRWLGPAVDMPPIPGGLRGVCIMFAGTFAFMLINVLIDGMRPVRAKAGKRG